MKHKGKWPHRFKDNPEEKRFAEAWEEKNEHGNTLAYLLSDDPGRLRPVDPSDRDRLVAATVIQWLGSEVGQFFLNKLGYSKDSEVKLQELAKKVETVVPYVTATISPGNRFEAARKDYVEVHKGRTNSSFQQLEHLLQKAREVLK